MEDAHQKEKSHDKSILSEQWEKDAPFRMASVKYMSEHPLTHEQMIEQKRRNEEIRRKNMEEAQRRGDSYKEQQ